MTSYHDIRGRVQPFDIFLFSGTGFISRVIQRITGSKWSHVALCLRLPGYDFNLIYESTTLTDLPDLTTGAKVKGVQLHFLSERIKSYDGEVAWLGIDGSRAADSYDKVAELVRRFQGRPYEQNQLELLRSALDATRFGQNQPDTSSLFCSELSAEVLRAAGVLRPGQPSNEFTPADFVAALDLHDGYTLGPVVELG